MAPSPGATAPMPAKPKAAQTRRRTHRVAQARMRSCYDLAWQSQAMKDCLARHPEQSGQIESGPGARAPMMPAGPGGRSQ